MAIRKKRSFSDFLDTYFGGFEQEFERWREAVIEKPSWNLKTCALQPLSDVRVTATEVVITVDLPLTQEKTLEVKPLDDRTLEISAEMKRKIQFKEMGITYRKGEFRKLHCHTRVPVPVEMNKLHVAFKKGILEIRIPCKKEH